jgi:hypothetical protein
LSKFIFLAEIHDVLPLIIADGASGFNLGREKRDLVLLLEGVELPTLTHPTEVRPL